MTPLGQRHATQRAFQLDVIISRLLRSKGSTICRVLEYRAVRFSGPDRDHKAAGMVSTAMLFIGYIP